MGSKDCFEGIEKLDVSDYEIDGEEIHFNKKPRIEIEIRKLKELLRTKVKVELDIKLLCSKCLDKFDIKEVKEFEGELSNYDDYERENLILMEDDELNLMDILDMALMEIIQSCPKCKEDCKGLCPSCGANFNHTSCNCNEKSININPEFEKLRKIFL